MEGSSEMGDGGVRSNFYAPTVVSVSVTYFFHMSNLIPELAAVGLASESCL